MRWLLLVVLVVLVVSTIRAISAISATTRTVASLSVANAGERSTSIESVAVMRLMKACFSISSFSAIHIVDEMFWRLIVQLNVATMTMLTMLMTVVLGDSMMTTTTCSPIRAVAVSILGSRLARLSMVVLGSHVAQ